MCKVKYHKSHIISFFITFIGMCSKVVFTIWKSSMLHNTIVSVKNSHYSISANKERKRLTSLELDNTTKTMLRVCQQVHHFP